MPTKKDAGNGKYSEKRCFKLTSLKISYFAFTKNVKREIKAK